MSMIALAYSPCPNHEEAVRLAKVLLERKLIACANIFPITSVYEWEGKVVEDGEVVLIAKTSREGFPVLRQALEELHPYDVPCILELSGDANDSYTQWLLAQVAP